MFERESLIVQLITTLKRYTNILVFIAVIYILIELFIQRYTLIGVIASILFILLMVVSIYIVAGEISYTYSKKIGGRRAKSLVKKDEGILGTIKYNLKLMRKEEWKLINKILRVNHLDSPNALRELKNYYSTSRPAEKYEIRAFIKTLAGVYILPMALGIISLYTAITNHISLKQNIINVSYIIVVVLIIIMIMLIIYIIYSLKKFSVTNIYTLPKIEKLLVEMILNKEKNIDKEYKK